MNSDYLTLRDELASVLREVPGVLSVGIGKEDSRIVLVVAIDPIHFTGGVPSSFDGVAVVLRDLGMAKLYSLWRSG